MMKTQSWLKLEFVLRKAQKKQWTTGTEKATITWHISGDEDMLSELSGETPIATWRMGCCE